MNSSMVSVVQPTAPVKIDSSDDNRLSMFTAITPTRGKTMLQYFVNAFLFVIKVNTQSPSVRRMALQDVCAVRPAPNAKPIASNITAKFQWTSALLSALTVAAAGLFSQTANADEVGEADDIRALAASFVLSHQDPQGVSGEVGEGDATVYFETKTPTAEQMAELTPGAELPVSVRFYDAQGHYLAMRFAADPIAEWGPVDELEQPTEADRARRAQALDVLRKLPAVIEGAAFSAGLDQHRRGLLELLRASPADPTATPPTDQEGPSPGPGRVTYSIELWGHNVTWDVGEHTAVAVYEWDAPGHHNGRRMHFCNHGDCPNEKASKTLFCSSWGEWGPPISIRGTYCDEYRSLYSFCGGEEHNCNADALLQREHWKDRERMANRRMTDRRTAGGGA